MLPLTVLRRFESVLAPTKAKVLRRFNELANETAGDHFTPREVIRLMVNLLFIYDDVLLATPGTVRKLLDPGCGTGGMLAEAQNYLRDHHADARLYVFGQNYNKHTFAAAASDMLMKNIDQNGYSNNNFYVYMPPRALAEIDADLKRAEDEILRLLQEVTT